LTDCKQRFELAAAGRLRKHESAEVFDRRGRGNESKAGVGKLN
jgi:hypothetical protein